MMTDGDVIQCNVKSITLHKTVHCSTQHYVTAIA